MHTFHLDPITRLEVRHRWVFHDEYAALMIVDDHGCRNEILIPAALLQSLQAELGWIIHHR